MLTPWLSIKYWLSIDKYYLLDQIRQSDMFSRSFTRPQAETYIVKFRLLLIETLISVVSPIFLLSMGNISTSDYLVLWQLKRSWSFYQPNRQPLFSNESGVNFEFEFCNNIEDKFNWGMSCITYSVVLHVYLRISQILFTFNRLQVMHSVFSIALSGEVAYKGLLLIQQHSKVQGQA